ncbi:MAG: CBS domain-containing protein [Bacteroidia bacterium]|nr:CBS domain-containing protein [Bacteroidia bacterium]
MIARELISDIFPSAKSSDQAGRALNWMNEFKLHQLPIVDSGRYVGMISEDQIMDAADLSMTVGQIKSAMMESAFLYEESHVYEAIELMSNFKLEMLPVLDEENKYLGVITLRDLALYLGQLFAIQEPGSIMVMEIPSKSFVLSEIARRVEEENAIILSMYLAPIRNTQDMLLTLKINVEDLDRITASMERFGYKIIQLYHRGASRDNFNQNLEGLLKYLDM